LKYQEFKSLGFELGRQIGEKLHEWNVEADLIIPVPLHKIKFRERGYNQSDLIAMGISSVIEKPVLTDTIRRIRHTETQTKLNMHQRQTNMQNAFQINSKKSGSIKGKTCLLVDDVVTTGATTNSCAKELATCGAKAVIAASAALAE
jgi:competence protein ComFC